jgi:phenylacetate-CoA ligase
MFEPEAETMPPQARAWLQSERLAALIDRLLAADGPQASLLRAAGVTSGAGLTIADLPSLPTTAKQDLWDSYPSAW